MPEMNLEINIGADDPTGTERVIRASVRDGAGVPIAGAAVTFAAGGSGSFDEHDPLASTASAETNGDGFAWARWVRPERAAGSSVHAVVRISTPEPDAILDARHFSGVTRVGPFA